MNKKIPLENKGIVGTLAAQQAAQSVLPQQNEVIPSHISSISSPSMQNVVNRGRDTQASGLSALTQGPAGAGTGTLADRDYNTLMGGLNAGSAFEMKSTLKQGSYENPEQVVDVDTSAADAIDQIGQITSNVVSKSGDETDSDDNKKEEK